MFLAEHSDSVLDVQLYTCAVPIQYATKAFKSDSLVPQRIGGGGGGGGGDCYILSREKGCTGAKPGHPKPEQEVQKGQNLIQFVNTSTSHTQTTPGLT